MKFLVDVKSTFDSIIFDWDECKSNLQNIYDFVEIFLKITDPYNKISTRIIEHTLRVMKIAERIMNKEVADKEIVLIAILLHDISKTLCENSHHLLSYRLAELLFEKYPYLDHKKKKILDCILYHSAKDLVTIDLTSEMKVIMDADIIDEVGILLISRICLRTHNKNYSVHELEKVLDSKYSKIEKETVYLKTKTGRELYVQKKKKFKEYIDAFKMEIAEYKFK